MIYGIKSREDLNMGCPAIYYSLFPCVDENGIADTSKMEVISR